jgi:hypothetical protein
MPTFWGHPGFVWVTPKIRASPNFRAAAQAGVATAAPCDSCDGDPQETQQDHFLSRPKEPVNLDRTPGHAMREFVGFFLRDLRVLRGGSNWGV